jgi:hypothetical protein
MLPSPTSRTVHAARVSRPPRRAASCGLHTRYSGTRALSSRKKPAVEARADITEAAAAGAVSEAAAAAAATCAATGKERVSASRRSTPRSVMMPVMSAAGVTSNAGFHTPMPMAATRSPRTCVSSSGARSSMRMLAPSGVCGSSVEHGAAT